MGTLKMNVAKLTENTERSYNIVIYVEWEGIIF